MTGTEPNEEAQQGRVRQLYPLPERAPLAGLYLAHDLRSCVDGDTAYVYSNFIASLDGRIAVARAGDGSTEVPRETANSRDWRLLLELAAPADALIVSGRFVRELASGSAQSAPPLEGDVPAELLNWRREQGLTAQPALVVVSNSLVLPVESLLQRERQIVVITSEAAPADRARSLEARGIEVIRAGGQQVDGRRMVAALAGRDLKLIYSVAGPAVMHTLLEARVLHRLYLTTVLRVLSGEGYATLAQGPQLDPAYDFELSSLYLDPCGPDGVGQLLQVFDCARR
jgi:riboflavin biosynthesis pyrimidine reductase